MQDVGGGRVYVSVVVGPESHGPRRPHTLALLSETSE